MLKARNQLTAGLEQAPGTLAAFLPLLRVTWWHELDMSRRQRLLRKVTPVWSSKHPDPDDGDDRHGDAQSAVAGPPAAPPSAPVTEVAPPAPAASSAPPSAPAPPSRAGGSVAPPGFGS